MNNFSKAGLITCLAFMFFVLGLKKSSSQTYCTNSGTSRYAGEVDGFRYELWNQNGQGTACMTLGSGALFSGEWSGILNYLARRGLGYNQTKEHQEIGTFYAKYNCDYKPSSASGNSYLSIYGWTVDPLKEFYIIENWRNWIPSMAAGATKKGTIEVNGSIYDIYVNTRVNQPSIQGTTTFQQYFSIRRNVRNSGTISISEHFDKWESLGMEMGKMYEVSFVVEGYQSSGSFNFSELDVFTSDDPVGIEANQEHTAPATIYPNPSSGEVFVYIDEPHINSRVQIINLSGRIVYSRKNINNSFLEVSKLKSGLYFFTLNNEELNYTTKFLVY
ncbi:MAG: glycoside hydrolase family 11 protein [Prolixibacteraceae bacterium]|nr:glycoside hydrolase family 11 protein [Prolixibacteraceae bacterium]